ncbi:hypothetical protein LTR35_018105 [Friedmanniomyces endolithicus]|uniref:SnoaL-like domain-containing protein n=1 Tax=Friedmanniomyces endolithicus TaxID=329885 RepID=A0AAN6F2Y3_9PEZI|nr:hypothetical protein LTR35_018105 [Friedmanniomyces endolithicus]KAK0265310.1 hypothetical protein LTS00_017994 [Friedmanniomyces endolithicus]KAK0301795.1 hypothetical protein LTR82_018119 [Friedmanniomyces endolithicus]KAK0968807.1 hypothetical protein LTR54_018171 [Friedmanniomyces endolithicus]
MASDYELIRNASALFCVAVDTQNWTLLGKVFNEDASLDHPEAIVAADTLFAFQAKLAASLKDLTTQHAVSTQHIDLHDDATAEVITYVIVSHWGAGAKQGQTLPASGRYVTSGRNVMASGRLAAGRPVLLGLFMEISRFLRRRGLVVQCIYIIISSNQSMLAQQVR